MFCFGDKELALKQGVEKPALSLLTHYVLFVQSFSLSLILFICV